MKNQIETFLDYLLYEKNYSEHTWKSYQRDLEEFNTYLKVGRSGKIALEALDHITIRDFLGHLVEKGNGKRSVARKLASLRSFFRFLHRRGELESNPAQLVATPKQPVRTPQVLTVRQIEELLSLPDLSTHGGQRDRAILEVLYGTGVRVGELVSLNLASLGLQEGLLKVRGKGKEERLVPFGRPASEALREYLPTRNRIVRARHSAFLTEALFVNLRGGALERPLRAANPGGLCSAVLFDPVGSSPLAASHLRDASSQQRGRPEEYPGTPGPQEPLHNPEVHPSLSGRVSAYLPLVPPQGLACCPGSSRGSVGMDFRRQ